MTSNIFGFLLFVCLILKGVQPSADICEILDANYCFYFSDSSCYINLCQCDACSKPDEVQSILLDSDSPTNSTIEKEKLCPTWCPHIKNNDTILNILGSSNQTSELQEISFECEDLEKNCLSHSGYNGHCYFYEKQCGFKHAIAMRGKNKKDQNQLQKCVKLQRKCHNKYPKHFACRQLKKKCRGVKLPQITSNDNSTIISNSTTQKSNCPLEQCINFQKICFNKYPKHFACRQFNRKCQEYSLPPLSSTIPTATAQVTVRPKKLHKKSGNSTIIITAGGQFVNSSLVEDILRL
ncbi:unnamed protein product [Caenorhabditis angaria]|uniref:Domain of unknown function DX domain-containing protein n=1 Tax=Caenorhabditis angaria TaxID=860376 RepID=A0A9P1MW03_9PELO|nr:unnamed protein product [Caenorhabditis angaria]